MFHTDREDIAPGDRLLLTYRGQKLAVMDVSSKWLPNKPWEAQQCYGTTSIEHPAVRMISGERSRYYLGGSVHGLSLPHRGIFLPNPYTTA